MAPLLVVLHMVFMTGAWVITASIGIFTARYFKTESAPKVFEKVHVAFMILTVAMTIAAFVLTFVHARNLIFSQDGKIIPHSIIGIAVMFLCILNALMVFCTNDGNKTRLKWSHFLVGQICHILALVNVLLGTFLAADKHFAPEWTSYVVIVFIGIHFTVWVLMEVYQWYFRDAPSEANQGGKVHGNGLHDNAVIPRRKPDETFKHVIFVLYIISAVGTTITIIAGICAI